MLNLGALPEKVWATLLEEEVLVNSALFERFDGKVGALGSKGVTTIISTGLSWYSWSMSVSCSSVRGWHWTFTLCPKQDYTFAMLAHIQSTLSYHLKVRKVILKTSFCIAKSPTCVCS